jgi:hypothetical protein
MTHDTKHDIAACIPEGWTLIKDKAISHVSADAHLRIVLCVRSRRGVIPRNPYGEFVTWVANVKSPECFEGHYFGELLPAAADYVKRGVKEEPKVSYESPAWSR